MAVAVGSIVPCAQAQDEIPYTDTFFLEDCRLSFRGHNDYFILLKPHCFLLLEGDDEGNQVTLLIEVLPDVRVVDGVRCAVLRETEWADGELVEISWNYVAICRDTDDIFYFGKDVDIYEDGEVVSHDGAWLAGENTNRAGLLMPGRPLNGSRYFQEIAPGVAMDRAEHLSNTGVVDTPAGTFENCLLVLETTPLEPGEESFKAYARGIGLIQYDVLKLVDYGCVKQEDDEGEEEEHGAKKKGKKEEEKHEEEEE